MSTESNWSNAKLKAFLQNRNHIIQMLIYQRQRSVIWNVIFHHYSAPVNLTDGGYCCGTSKLGKPYVEGPVCSECPEGWLCEEKLCVPPPPQPPTTQVTTPQPVPTSGSEQIVKSALLALAPSLASLLVYWGDQKIFWVDVARKNDNKCIMIIPIVFTWW